jgi:hypothetical protein
MVAISGCAPGTSANRLIALLRPYLAVPAQS